MEMTIINVLLIIAMVAVSIPLENEYARVEKTVEFEKIAEKLLKKNTTNTNNE